MKKHNVMRTRAKGSSYNYEYECFKKLDTLLMDGWLVIMVTPIGDELEYILEKEI